MLLTLGITGISKANLLTNGDAEEGDLTGWTTDYPGIIGAVESQGHIVYPFEGEYFFSFATASANPDPTIWMYQYGSLSGIDVPLVLSGWVQTGTWNDFSDVGIATLAIYDAGFNPLAIAYIDDLITPNSEWVFFDICLEIPAGASYWVVKLDGTVSPDSYANVFWDDVQLNPVPEPSTMLLLAAGLLGIAGFGRKKFFKR
jgi:hypothetical protein